jgi:catalase
MGSYTPRNDDPVYTASNGAPVKNPEASMRVGGMGPLLLQDFHLIDQLAHFDRERIPERVVHAKGAGAYGFFEVTHDLADIVGIPQPWYSRRKVANTDSKCSIDMFSEVGKKTDLVVRFSTVGGEKGSADTARDPRGFSIKFYTDEGNWDWVFNDTPIFFIRDPTLFPIFIHTQKRNPQTNLKDATAFWDYLSTHQESVHQVMHTFSDRGTPLSYRHMNGYSGHVFKFTNPDGSFKYVKIHIISDQGIENLSNDEAHMLSADDPDWNTKDLFESIERGQYPTWTVSVQVMDPADAANYRWSMFDLTKVWPHKDAPLREVGKITLNRNVRHPLQSHIYENFY